MKKTKDIHIRISDEDLAKIKKIAGKYRKLTSVLEEAIDLYLAFKSRTKVIKRP